MMSSLCSALFFSDRMRFNIIIYIGTEIDGGGVKYVCNSFFFLLLKKAGEFHHEHTDTLLGTLLKK